jgi:hypothetical protein
MAVGPRPTKGRACCYQAADREAAAKLLEAHVVFLAGIICVRNLA